MENTANPTHSSAATGFFQVLPKIEPQFTSPSLASDSRSVSDDAVLARILQQYLPPQGQRDVGLAIHNLSRRVLHPSTLRYAVEAETNIPTLQPFTTFGKENRDDPLRTCEGWKALKAMGIEEGVVARAYDQSKTTHNRRIEQFGLAHVWSHTSTLTMCPMSMTDGVATLLLRHMRNADNDQPGRSAVIAESYRRLVSLDPREAWTSGQWMTERTGGSDVSGTETIAQRLTTEELASDISSAYSQDAVGLPLGPWRIDGFKWFSSATDSDMTVLLAKTPKGLDAFISHCLDSENEIQTELNGISVQRLKNKLGTRGLPTAELEIKGARGWLIGEEGKGIKEISAILNITRIHTSTSSASYWARGLSICRAYSKVRKVRGRFLYENSQHMFWMARETVKYWAATHFVFFGVALLGCSEQGWGPAAQNTAAEALIPRDRGMREALLRLLTPVIKAQVSMGAVSGLRESMECLGGVGYCGNHEDGGILNLAKIFRDSVVNTIWEGTVSVMAEDVRRVLRDRRIGDGNTIETVFGTWIQYVLQLCREQFTDECDIVQKRLQALIAIVKRKDEPELEYRGRDILEHLEAITSATLLLYNACIDGNQVACYIASRYTKSKALSHIQDQPKRSDWKREAEIDRLIFLGEDFRPTTDPQQKL
ncbi:acyl-CoA dehydrogenase/oxidase [Biscogniauxia marginata]|nr:acyl-CoA dehydrogenase/oxidase [Biscogniauxia marginata]